MRMEKPTEPAKIGSVDVEAFSRNLARLIEEGGKALAAYLKPREEGKIKSDLSDDVSEVVRTVGKVADYWLSDPQRALELQTSLGRAYLDLWAGAVKRMAGEQASPVVAPDPRDRRFV
ncbi:MAG: class I poly(R)-hydroxyalkanoic acid synthase, partial [Pseudolabrys sp.]